MSLPIRKSFVVACCLQAAVLGTLAGENLIPEGSDFEAGLNGFQVKSLAFPQNCGSLVAPQIDASTAAYGKRSLKLTNASGQDSFRITSRTFLIPNEGNVSLSFSAKSDPPGVPIWFALCNGYDKLVTGEARTEGEWKRFQVNGTPKQWFSSDSGSAKGCFYVQIRIFSPIPWKTVWIDGIQLENGPPTDYKNPTAVDLAFEMDRGLKVYHPEETPKLTLSAAGKMVAGTSVKVQLEEMFSGRKEPEQTIPLAADGDSDHARAVIPLKPQPRGSYRITARTVDGKAVQYQVYGVIVPMGSRPRSARIFFGGSIENIMPLESSAGLPGSKDHSLGVWGIDPDQMFALARDLGWGWWHAYHAFSIASIQPNSSKEFRWLDGDYLAELARKHDLEIYSNLMGHGGLLPDYPPAWLRSAALSQGGGDNRGKGQRLVDVQKIEASTRAIVDHYKSAIKTWEPWNEPGTKMREGEYLPIQQAVYRGAKAADPACRVFGLCGTFDAGGDLYGWVKTSLKMGAAASMDGIAIHGYHVPDRDYVDKVRQFTRAAIGKDLPIIDSEAGNELNSLYPQLLSSFKPEGDSTSPEDKAHHAVSHLANILAHGAERQSWFNLIGYDDGINYPSYTLLEYDGAPSMSLVAINVFIDRLGLGKFKTEVSLGGDVVIYVFDVEGRGIAVLWTEAKPQIVEIPLKPEQVILENIAGQKITAEACPTGLRLPLARQLCYLRSNELNGEQLAQALRRGGIPSLQSVEITRVGFDLDEKNRAALSVALKGRSPKAQTGSLELLNTPNSWQLEKTQATFEGMVLNQEKRFLFPLTAGLEKSTGDTIQVGLEGERGIVTCKLPLKTWVAAMRTGEIKLDGDLQDWNARLFRQIAPWVSAAVQWDAHGMWFAARVQDATPRSFQETPGKAPWQSDCVELFFNAFTRDSFRDKNYGAGDCQVVCAVRGGGKSTDAVDACGAPGGVNTTLRKDTIKMASKRDAAGYTVEIFFPWTNLPAPFMAKPGVFLGFDMSVRDVDNSHEDLRRIIWAGDNDNYRYTDKFGTLILSP